MFWETLLIIVNPHTIPNKKAWYQYLGIRKMEGLNVFESVDLQIQVLKKLNMMLCRDILLQLNYWLKPYIFKSTVGEEFFSFL